MASSTHISYRADDKSYFSVLKRDIHQNALQAGYHARKLGELDIIVSEMTSNLLKHTKGGEILLFISDEPGKEYLELISIDHGPGMADPERMMADGVSSTGTLGHGFGSMQRLSDFFQVYSLFGWGTIVLSRIYKNGAVYMNPLAEIRSIVVPKPGEKLSGDGCIYKTHGNFLEILELDGLGHGVEANKVVTEAFRLFRQCQFHEPVEIIRYLHESLKRSRGAVGTVIIYNGGKWMITGVGNITTRMLSPISSRTVMPYNGIIGHNIPNSMKSQEMDPQEFKQVILCSDGIKSGWDTSRYFGIRKYDLSILAACIYKDYARKTDDMSVVVAKINKI